MAYNFNDETGARTGGEAPSATGTAAAASPAAPSADAAAPDAPQSAGFARFNSCRWQQPKDENSAAFCTHREVKPYAGTTGFDPEAWCVDCQYYKLRRAPKKRNPDEYRY